MMKRVLFPLLVMLLSLTGCMHNNGDIGDLYGLWRLDSLEADGYPTTTDCSTYTWRFQNDIIVITHQIGNHDIESSFGSWSRSAGRLILDFTHTNNVSDHGGATFNPPTEMYLPPRRVLSLEIITLTSKHLTLTYTADDGVVYRYTLTKYN